MLSDIIDLKKLNNLFKEFIIFYLLTKPNDFGFKIAGQKNRKKIKALTDVYLTTKICSFEYLSLT